MKMIAAISILLFGANAFAQNCNEEETPDLNKEIVSLTLQKLGKKVDRGECWDLAYYVLNETKADWDGFEVYGELIDTSETCILPGDIIQFEKVKLKYKEGKVTYTESMYHHTAIVVEVIDQRHLVIAHQNTGQTGKKVGKSNFDLNSVQSGKLLFYQPVKN